MSKRLIFTATVAGLAMGLAAPALAGGASRTSHSASLTSSADSGVTFAGGSLADNDRAQVDLVDYTSLRYFDRLLVDPSEAGAISVEGQLCSASGLSFFGEVQNWANVSGPQMGRVTLRCTIDGQEYRYTWGHSGSPANCVAFERTSSDATTTSYSFVATGACVASVATVARNGKPGPSTATTATLNMSSVVQGAVRSE